MIPMAISPISSDDPVVAEGPVRILTSPDDLLALAPGELAGQMAVVDFALIDKSVDEYSAKPSID